MRVFIDSWRVAGGAINQIFVVISIRIQKLVNPLKRKPSVWLPGFIFTLWLQMCQKNVLWPTTFFSSPFPDNLVQWDLGIPVRRAKHANSHLLGHKDYLPVSDRDKFNIFVSSKINKRLQCVCWNYSGSPPRSLLRSKIMNHQLQNVEYGACTKLITGTYATA